MQRTRRSIRGCLVAMALATLWGCAPREKEDARPAEQAEPGSMPEALALHGPVDQAFAAYEKIRSQLAGDSTTGVGEAAEGLESAARSAIEMAPEALRGAWARLADAAGGLNRSDAADLVACREAFGEVSEALIDLVGEEPSLAAGRYVFECPMVEGYQKWVQASASVENPYKGSEMLECGVATTWTN